MDSFCSIDKYSKAKEIFDNLSTYNIEPNSFSYSILIKGLKKVDG